MSFPFSIPNPFAEEEASTTEIQTQTKSASMASLTSTTSASLATAATSMPTLQEPSSTTSSLHPPTASPVLQSGQSKAFDWDWNKFGLIAGILAAVIILAGFISFVCKYRDSADKSSSKTIDLEITTSAQNKPPSPVPQYAWFSYSRKASAATIARQQLQEKTALDITDEYRKMHATPNALSSDYHPTRTPYDGSERYSQDYSSQTDHPSTRYSYDPSGSSHVSYTAAPSIANYNNNQQQQLAPTPLAQHVFPSPTDEQERVSPPVQMTPVVVDTNASYDPYLAVSAGATPLYPSGGNAQFLYQQPHPQFTYPYGNDPATEAYLSQQVRYYNPSSSAEYFGTVAPEDLAFYQAQEFQRFTPSLSSSTPQLHQQQQQQHYLQTATVSPDVLASDDLVRPSSFDSRYPLSNSNHASSPGPSSIIDKLFVATVPPVGLSQTEDIANVEIADVDEDLGSAPPAPPAKD